MKEALLGIMLGFITAGGSILVAKIGAKTQRSTAMTPSYEALDTRNTNLEKRLDEQDKKIADLKAKDEAKDDRIDELERRLTDALADRDGYARAVDDLKLLVRQFIAWVNSGSKPPPPTIPAHLRDSLGEDYELAHITERSHTFTQTERIIIPPEEQP